MKKIECEGVGDSDGFFEIGGAAIPKQPVVMCSVALLYTRDNHHKVMAALIPIEKGDKPEDSKAKAEQYQSERCGEELDGFEVVAWQVATPN